MSRMMDADKFLSWLSEVEGEIRKEKMKDCQPDRYDDGLMTATGTIREYVEKMCKIDNADSKRGWIPVTERLPEDERDVLLTLESTNGYREYSVGCYIQVFDEDAEKHWFDRQYGYLEWDRYSNGHGGCSLYRVTAWMPIPNLYKG